MNFELFLKQLQELHPDLKAITIGTDFSVHLVFKDGSTKNQKKFSRDTKTRKIMFRLDRFLYPDDYY